MAVEIFIARHGQNEDNANGILNGHRDLPLTELGRQQARELGEGILRLGLEFHGIYSSPLSRALDTAKIICKVAGLQVEPVVVPEMIERDFGTMTGRRVADIAAICGSDIICTETITYFLHPEGAETYPNLLERGYKVLERVRELQRSGNALLVCHGDLGKMVYAAATGRQWQDVLTNFHFGNCDLIEVSPSDDAHVIRLEQANL